MVHTFPQRIEQPVVGLHADINDQLCEEFEDIEKTGDYKSFFAKYFMFPYGWLDFETEKLSEDDYYGVRDVLYLMFRLRELATSEETSNEDLANAGVSFYYIDFPDVEGKIAFPRLEFPVRGRIYMRYLLETINGDYSMASEWPFEKLPDQMHRDYGPEEDQDDEWCFDEDMESFMTKSAGGIVYHLRRGQGYGLEDEDATPEFFAARMLDELCGLHLRGVDTLTRDGIPFQCCRHGVAALWLAYLNRLSHVRITTCEACGKPIVVTGERGQKRRYCDDTCRKWANRNPGKKRSMRIRN